MHSRNRTKKKQEGIYSYEPTAGTVRVGNLVNLEQVFFDFGDAASVAGLVISGCMLFKSYRTKQKTLAFQAIALAVFSMLIHTFTEWIVAWLRDSNLLS